jgi:predicted dehydrogenase
MKTPSVILIFWFIMQTVFGQEPVKIAIAGLSHSHVVPLLRNLDRPDIQIVGIAESDTALSNRYGKQFNIRKELIYVSLDEMLDKTMPDGVVTFTSIYDHLKVVEACAPLGIDVMVEKPLAVSTRHATRMKKLAENHGTMVLTNYETTWYPSNHEGFKMISDGEIGQVRKILVYDGHKGPKEINVNPEFLEWLTHPDLNGGGAVTDFGCYGANLVTWILNGQKPESVFASLKQYKPDIYPYVDDDATILLSYPQMEAVINASWNWPFNRKDMHVYGTNGYILIDDAETIRYKLEERSEEKTKKASREILKYNDPFAFFAAVITGDTEVGPYDLSSLENNLIVVEILEAASKSSRTGRKIKLRR